MCDINTLQQKIADLTNNGEIVIRFLAETVQGKTPAVQPCHRLEATSQLIRLGNLGDNTPSPLMGEGRDGGDRNKESARPEPVEGHTSFRHSRESGNPEARDEESSLSSDNTARPEPVLSIAEGPVEEPTEGRTQQRPSEITYLDILNFNLAQLIRSETADGHTIVEFLLHIMTGRDSAYTPNKLRIKPADRMAASREILRRGYGHFGRRRRLIDDAEETNDYDTLHTDLAKRLRQYSEEGSQAILFLLNVMKNEVPDEEYTTRHRMSAAQELLRRGWDTNYDKIKSEHLMDYWQEQQSARLSVGQKKQLAGLQTYADEYDAYDNTDYEPQAQALRAQQDRESEAISPRHSRESEAASPRHSRASGNPEAPNKETSRASKPTPSPNPKNTYNYTKSDPDPEQDGYYEPLSPEDQALFDYHTKIESGDYEEGEIQPRPVTEADRLGYQAMLKWIHETAAAEGVPVLSNPLSGTLKHPNARSP